MIQSFAALGVSVPFVGTLSRNRIAVDLQPLAAWRGLRTAAVYGGTWVGGQAARAREAQILVATPGRLHDLLERRPDGRAPA